MKKLLFILLLLSTLSVHAQVEYTTQKNIHYYNDQINKSDPYIDSICTIDLYYPKNTNNYPTVLWFHGGGMTGGEKEIPKALLDKGFAVVGVGYRLSPRAKAPAYINDAAAATAWVFQHIAEYGGNDKLIFVSGHSAGGYLDLMITLDKDYLAKYNIDANRVAEIIPFSPQAITHFTVRQEEGIRATQPTIDKYAPLYWVRTDAPPMLLITGDPELELLGRYEENAYLLRMMKLNNNKTTRLLKLEGYDHGGMPVAAFPLLIKEVKERTKAILANNK